MKITVTKACIDNGFRRSSNCCPVAIALKNQFKTNDVGVGIVTARIGGDIFAMPQVATDFILAFDRLQKVQPFTFELEM